MEAALTLPVFILCIVALALVIRVIGICENISYVTCQETRKIALNSYHDLNAVSLCKWNLTAAVRKENPALRQFRVQNFDYLYEDTTDGLRMRELIAVDTKAEFEVKNPIGIYGKIVFTQGLLCRGFTGAERSCQPLPARAFSEGGSSRLVLVFPKYGYRFHSRSCRYVRQYEKENSYRLEMQQRDAQGKGYTACLICGGDLDETYGDS